MREGRGGRKKGKEMKGREEEVLLRNFEGIRERLRRRRGFEGVKQQQKSRNLFPPVPIRDSIRGNKWPSERES